MERHSVSSGSPFEQSIGFSRAVRVGERVLVAGTAPVAEGGGCAAPGDAHGQARRCLEIVGAALAEAGCGFADVVRTRVYLTHSDAWRGVARAHAEVFGRIRPVSTFVVVAGLLDPAWLVEIEVEAVVGAGA